MVKWFIKFIEPLIEKIFFEMFDQQAKVWKFRENNDYRELENDTDRGLKKVKVEHEILKDVIKDAVNEVNKIKNKFEKFKKIRSL